MKNASNLSPEDFLQPHHLMLFVENKQKASYFMYETPI